MSIQCSARLALEPDPLRTLNSLWQSELNWVAYAYLLTLAYFPWCFEVYSWISNGYIPDRDSNPGPLEYCSAAIPTKLPGRSHLPCYWIAHYCETKHMSYKIMYDRVIKIFDHRITCHSSAVGSNPAVDFGFVPHGTSVVLLSC